MKRASVSSDPLHRGSVGKEKRRYRPALRLAAVLLLGAGLQALAQVSLVPVPGESYTYGHAEAFSRGTRRGPTTERMLNDPNRPAKKRAQCSPHPAGVTCDEACLDANCFPSLDPKQQTLTSSIEALMPQSPSADPGVAAENSETLTSTVAQSHERADMNAEIYRRNRLDFAVDVGWHPVNIPFIYDFAVGDSYNMTPLKYTLVPIIASLRWQVTNVGWPWILRGNMDFTFSGSITAIPRGPETHYYAFMFGIRRNFVHRNWKAVPFFEQRGGAGIIDAKEPLGVLFAQGQNLTFTYNLGVGVRYSFNTKYSLSGGMNYMHISNGYLSQPQFYNYGINVYGPMFGFDMRLGKPRQISQ